MTSANTPLDLARWSLRKKFPENNRNKHQTATKEKKGIKKKEGKGAILRKKGRV